MTGDLSMATVNLKRDEAAEQIRTRAEAGEDPMKIIDECREGVLIVGDRYNQGEFFLAERGSIRTDFQAGIRNITKQSSGPQEGYFNLTYKCNSLILTKCKF